jgi:hypothetical protein
MLQSLCLGFRVKGLGFEAYQSYDLLLALRLAYQEVKMLDAGPA